MYHSLIFHHTTKGERNTYKDWKLIPTSRPVINPPPIKENYLEIPGTDGSLDLSEAISGRVNYGNRTGSIEFAVENDHFEWAELYSLISEYLHGAFLEMLLEDDRSWVYKGRWSVNNWKSDPWYSLITLNYNLWPYKMERWKTNDRWLWDPFSFINGIARDYTLYNNVSVSGSKEIRLLVPYDRPVDRLRVDLTSGTLTLTIKYSSGSQYGVPIALKTGTNITPYYLPKGDFILNFEGTGVIKTIIYQGGSL